MFFFFEKIIQTHNEFIRSGIDQEGQYSEIEKALYRDKSVSEPLQWKHIHYSTSSEKSDQDSSIAIGQKKYATRNMVVRECLKVYIIDRVHLKVGQCSQMIAV